jgi:hypothetical protein
MTIDQREILARALDLIGYGSLSKDIASGDRAFIPSVAALAAMAEVERISRQKALEEAASAVDNAGWYQSCPDIHWEMADEQIAFSVRSVRDLMSPPVKDQAND